MKTTHLIIGAGEVGLGLYHYLLTEGIDVSIRDKEDEGFTPRRATVLHICFPWTDKFSSIVNTYINMYESSLTIIYTTVPVGTTKSLDHPYVVHSPVEGKHPDLSLAFGKFCRIIGFNSTEAYKRVLEYVPPLFNEFTLLYDTDKTELMKLLSTGYRYPAMIALAQEQERICGEYGFDYEEIVTQYDTFYNKGYKKLDNEKYTRPLMTPGWIGGHCVMTNLELLDRPNDPVLKWIKQSNKKKAQDYS